MILLTENFTLFLARCWCVSVARMYVRARVRLCFSFPLPHLQFVVRCCASYPTPVF